MFFSPQSDVVIRRLVSSYLIIFSLFLALLDITSTENMDSQELSGAVTKFSAKFCNELAKDKSVVSSPLSAEFVLALLTLGATDEVHTELLTSLDIPSDDAIRSAFTSVSSKLRSIKGVTLNAANKVYIMEGPYELNPTLKEDAIKVFDADFQKIDFANGAAAAETINNWVESKTNNRIKDLLSSDCLNSDTRLVLVNALYFKGNWAKQFNARYTAPKPFHLDETKTIDVPMMYQEDKFYYGVSEELKSQILRMHYIGNEASMVIVLPRDVNGLNEVMEKLAAGYNLNAEIQNLNLEKVQVTMPKFKIETEIDLTEVLPKLGVKAIFDPQNKGLGKILNTPEPLYVSKAVQKAFIEVNEEGAEAAAATGMALMMRCMPRPPQQFNADHPFLYMLLSGDTPTFLGFYRGQ